MRRFELPGQPVRFWEVTHDERLVEMRWGDVGATPKTFSRQFASEAEAEVFAQRQILGQQERGYVETTPVVPPPEVDRTLTIERFQRFERPGHFIEVTQEARKITVRGGRVVDGRDQPSREQLDVQHLPTIAAASAAFDARCANIRHEGGIAVDPEPTHVTRSNPELERECEASPDQPAPWAVYADWLIAHGDARGEIAALHAAGKIVEAKRRIGVHMRELCGTETANLSFEFRHGFATHCSIPFDPQESDDPLEDLTRDVLASPMGRFLESLRLACTGLDEDSDWGPTIHAVASSPRAAHVRALCFDDYYYPTEISSIRYGDFSGVWSRLPALERLHLKAGGGGTLGLVEHANLRTLIRESGGLAESEIAELLGARLPRLEHLELWFGQDMYGAEGDVTSIRPILDGDKYPALRHLGIVNCEFVEDAIPELARSRILPQLSTLDLSKGVIADRGAFLLIENAAHFRHLRSIDLAENFLTEANLARLRVVLPNIVVGEQREAFDDEDRFAAVGE